MPFPVSCSSSCSRSWFIPSKPEDQVRTYVRVFFWAMSLPAAVHGGSAVVLQHPHRHQAADHPHHRHQAGRALRGGAGPIPRLPGADDAGAAGGDRREPGHVLRGVTPEAAAESLKAREPLYGDLRFENTGSEKEAVNVGREWDYRSYITKSAAGKPQTACWDFAQRSRLAGSARAGALRIHLRHLPHDQGPGRPGRFLHVQVLHLALQAGQRRGLHRASAVRRAATGPKDAKLAEEQGYYEINAQPVTDYHTQNSSPCRAACSATSARPTPPARAN